MTLTTIAPILPPFTNAGANVVKLSVREAAKRFNISRPTLVKRLKSGQLSGEPVTGGGWLIDPAELIRAGYAARVEAGQRAPAIQETLTTIAPPLPGVGGDELVALKAALEAERIRREVAEALAEERLQHINDLRRMLPAPDAKPKRGWWPFGSGGR